MNKRLLTMFSALVPMTLAIQQRQHKPPQTYNRLTSDCRVDSTGHHATLVPPIRKAMATTTLGAKPNPKITMVGLPTSTPTAGTAK